MTFDKYINVIVCGVQISLIDVSKSLKEVHQTDQNVDEQVIFITRS